MNAHWIICVGEQWNGYSTSTIKPDALKRIQRDWSGSLSFDMSGMFGGYSYRRMRELGFRYGHGANCLGPGMKWDDAIAARVASELLDLRMKAYILCGQRVWKAFGCSKMLEWHYDEEADAFLLPVPHPSPRCPTWRKPGVIELARQRAVELANHTE